MALRSCSWQVRCTHAEAKCASQGPERIDLTALSFCCTLTARTMSEAGGGPQEDFRLVVQPGLNEHTAHLCPPGPVRCQG